VISVSYPRSLCGGNHGHFVALDSKKGVKTTVTLWHKPIAIKKPIDSPLANHQNLWTNQTKTKADALRAAYQALANASRSKSEKSRRGGTGEPTFLRVLNRSETGLGEADDDFRGASTRKSVLGHPVATSLKAAER
jgi:hypothetical protein